jgi:hypothetical protein
MFSFWLNPLSSSFIFFSMAKHKAIKENLAKEGGTGKVSHLATRILGLICSWTNIFRLLDNQHYKNGIGRVAKHGGRGTCEV